ncbi:hypothetical protein KI688_001287 [Linnemannia hyalina]|uniref:Uncharacterized protein n=1 Tax=Linnemannia hyalina TaxID=64524 RepID=A0A9P8BSA1_9FUNG|nr:hypothetical protein KI688_001287 [Linnemannia hyalina]
MEVLSTPGMADSQDVFERERRYESRIPLPKARRATAESVNRPNPRQMAASAAAAASYAQLSSAPSMPRPIPKGNNNKRTPIPQSKSAASSYTFDDTVANPFVSSTPSAFTPSMEPTSFLASRPSQEATSISTDSFFNSKSAANPNAPATTVTTTDTPAPPTSVAKPFMGAAARSRDASVSSLPGPRHEDMILPVVAKRIKEQGLFDHDVVAYSDDYNAPLYKAPSSPANAGNPFASYDRMKAASSGDLSNLRSLPESSSSAYNRKFDQSLENDQDLVQSKAGQDSRDEHNRASTSSENPVPSVSPPLSDASPNLSTGHSERRQRQRKETVESQQSQQHQQQASNGPSSSVATSPVTTQPDRPRRARRNTERSTRHDQYATYGDYGVQPVPQSPQSPQSRQEYLERTQQPSWDRPYLNNGVGQDPYAPPVNKSTRQEMTQNSAADGYQRQHSREQGYGQSRGQNQGQSQRQEYDYPSQGDQYSSRQQQQQSHSNNDHYQNQAAGQNHGYQGQQGGAQNAHLRPEMVQVEMSTMGNEPREGESSEDQQPKVVQIDAKGGPKKEKKGAVCCIIM